MNNDTQISPGIGPLAPQFSVLGGCIIDVVGINGKRATAQISAGSMFKGWVAGYTPTGWPLSPPVAPWKRVGATTFDGSSIAAALGGGITKANIRITLADGDSGSGNPVYVAMFGAGSFPYIRATTQPSNYDFDGGNNLYFGFEDIAGNPVSCGYMGAATTFRLDAAGATIDTFSGFPGIFALTDPSYAAVPKPAHYMTPVQAGQSPGVWPATGWFAVGGGDLSKLYAVLASGAIRVGINDALSPGDQYYDFTLGLAADVVTIPFETPQHSFLDLWVWRVLTAFTGLEQALTFPPGFQLALTSALAAEMLAGGQYPAASARYDYDEMAAEAEDAASDLDTMNLSDAAALEPPL